MRQQDADFDVDWVTSSSSTASNPPPKPSAPPPPRPSAPPPPRAPPPRPPPSASYPRSYPYGSAQSDMYLFLLHLVQFLTAFFHLLPILPMARSSYVMFLWFFRFNIAVNLYKIVLRFGSPAPYLSYPNINWQALQGFAQNAMTSNEFFYAMTSMSCLSLKAPLTLAMVPGIVIAFRSLAAHASRTLNSNPLYQRFAASLVAAVLAKGHVLDQTVTFAEIALMFYLIAMLITPSRNILMLFFYFNMLKTRYVAPDSSANHVAVWSKIDEITLPYRQKAPIVEQGIQMLKQYFLSVR